MNFLKYIILYEIGKLRILEFFGQSHLQLLSL